MIFAERSGWGSLRAVGANTPARVARGEPHKRADEREVA